DSVSHKMLGIRADITPQIARIVCTRLKDEPKPLRLCYANDVLRARAGQLRGVRQFCQVGCEMVGDQMPGSYVELVMLAVLGLKALGLKDITLDFTMPMALDALYQVEGTGEDKEALTKILASRAQSELAAMKGKLAPKLLALLKASGPMEEALKTLSGMALPPVLVGQVKDLAEIQESLTEALEACGVKDVTLSLDVFETKGSQYYKGLAFSLFAGGVRGELGRGGHYGVAFGSEETGLTATGFTLYMDTVQKALTAQPSSKRIAVLPGASWADILRLQGEGFVTVLVRDKKEAAGFDQIFESKSKVKG
ncbi:MAG: ATP phosphoribosyltransferase regulatory subunit, partial [Alphaproteobacteria bacterium]|nr:ATP phosphoribosyltransferase regulatory subunit [Alphaproteobacteria bacterium]